MEKPNYREQLALIRDIFPQKISLTVDEVALVLGKDRKTITALIERRTNPLPAQDVSQGRKNHKYIIPVTALARWTV
jgi:hypothetical protein